jgi:hypothetical protein
VSTAKNSPAKFEQAARRTLFNSTRVVFET